MAATAPYEDPSGNPFDVSHAGYPSFSSEQPNGSLSQSDLRDQLQSLLDEKTQHLQLAATLGQRLCDQQNELENRIGQLNELHSTNGESLYGDEDDSKVAEMRHKLEDLSHTLQQWEVENDQLRSGLSTGSHVCPSQPFLYPPLLLTVHHRAFSQLLNRESNSRSRNLHRFWRRIF